MSIRERLERLAEGDPCEQCLADRTKRWELMRAKNGLTEEDWPRPVAPTYADLLAHQSKAHGQH